MGEFFLPDNVLRRIMSFSGDLCFLTLTSLFSSQSLFNQIINMKYNTPVALIESSFLVIFTQTYFWSKFWHAKKGFYTKPFSSLYIHNWTIYAYVTNKRRHFSTSCALTDIMQFFHLSNNQIPEPASVKGDKLNKLRPLLDFILPKFGSLYYPGQNLSPDESMLKFKGRLSFLQYMPRKPVKWGMKALSLNESETGYTCSWTLYTGSATKETKSSSRPDVDTDSSPSKCHPSHLTIPGEVVIELVKGLEYKGHVIYCDNYFNSPALVSKLSKLGAGCCGPVRYNTRGIPHVAHPKTNRMKKGDDPKFYEKAGQLCIVWHGNNNVVLLTNVGDCQVSTKQIRCKKSESGFRDIAKPISIGNYNKLMGGTDLANQICQYYNNTHRSVKWWKRVFFNMLNICILNATIIFNSVPTNKHISNLDFRIKVVEGLLVGWERNTLLRCRRSTVSYFNRLYFFMYTIAK